MNLFELHRSTDELDTLPNICRGDGAQRLMTDATRTFLLRSGQLDATSSQCLRDATPLELAEATVASARARLILGISSQIAEAIPAPVRDEALLRLITDTSLYLEYIGRGSMTRVPDDMDSVMALDISGGDRRYLFRRTDAGDPHLDGSADFHSVVQRAHQWINDPDAKLVLSIGGGGYRMFAVTPILHFFDVLLSDRSEIAEVWGCSGGAVAAHAFAEGFDPGVLDKFAYDLYHGRRDIPDYSVWSVAKLWFHHFFEERKNPTRLKRAWIDALNALQPQEERHQSRLPFYAVAANTAENRLNALCLPEHGCDFCRDFMVDTPRDRALAASAAVPLLFPVQRSKEQDHIWVDGGLIDENPLALPFVKWQRERRRDPEGTPKKLKIFLIDLNARAAESSILNQLKDLPVVGSVLLQRIVEQVDLLLDSRQHLTLRMLADIPGVEVFRAQLSLGAFAVRDRRNILNALQSGRQLNAWNFATFGSPEDPDV